MIFVIVLGYFLAVVYSQQAVDQNRDYQRGYRDHNPRQEQESEEQDSNLQTYRGRVSHNSAETFLETETVNQTPEGFNSIPGAAGADYPTFDNIPHTSFTCEGKVENGYYADVETNCQVFHVCQTGGQKNSFLCPNGSIFNQKYSVCDWWYSFDCEAASDLYPLLNDVHKEEYINPQNTYNQEQQVNEYFDLNIASSGGNTAFGDYENKNTNTERKSTSLPKQSNRHGFESTTEAQTSKYNRNNQAVETINRSNYRQTGNRVNSFRKPSNSGYPKPFETVLNNNADFVTSSRPEKEGSSLVTHGNYEINNNNSLRVSQGNVSSVQEGGQNHYGGYTGSKSSVNGSSGSSNGKTFLRFPPAISDFTSNSPDSNNYQFGIGPNSTSSNNNKYLPLT